MYRSVILSIFFLLVSSVPLQAQEANELQGRALIAIYSSAESYPQSPYKTAMAKADSLTKTVLIDLPEGSYGISLFQDVNGNKTLDFNGYIPSEKYGFSNNYGLPSFKDILFTFKAGDIQYITLR